ncbi:lipid-A-disaccharide synthase [Brunnivagina elsteri]|uniref:Lipid-A-disaccharide synthase n=1 Tax=Brunnivagina elsteri CCALA 953 TaxID=987040 RepID=A0A2A2TNB0_9CYAN|nr:lipid-A-disaccharide synthase [Calothrix elsteri]PAX60026.1 lipid-A-disaccharide synthase [Calothrix elsteri CCALA 953]
MRIFISTGEVSGDLQGSLLIAALQRQAITVGLEVDIVALGGDKMLAAGATLLGNTTRISSFGLLEAIPYILPTLQIQRQAIAYLKENPPDIVVLIDYMGPNLAIANYLHRHSPNIPIIYYIAPQVWVSTLTTGDTQKIIDVSDKILAIFPGEARYFEEKKANVTWVGHPLLDRMPEFPSREVARANLGIADDAISVALLPASRPQELKYLMPVIFQTAKLLQEKIPQINFWIPLSLEFYREKIEKALQEYGLQATVISGQQKEVLAAADLAITKCGTVNLELGLLKVPQVVLYRLHPFSYWVAMKILKVKFPFASPVNLMVMKEIVPEFIQERATAENLTQAAIELLLNTERKQQMQANYQEMRENMGEVGVCDRVASEIFKLAKSGK